LPFGVVAIDGKGLGKLDSWDSTDIQKVVPKEGVPYGLARVHRAHLVSSDATVCIDQCPIPGNTNEWRAVRSFTDQLLDTYKRTELFEVITADAGNSSIAHAKLIHNRNMGYVLAVKQPNGEIYQEAYRQLAGCKPSEAESEETRREKGHWVTHRLWRAPIGGYLQWTHARQLVRVERRVRHNNGTTSVGNRYFVTNLPKGRLKGVGWLTLIRMHWRCENEGHWTADVLFSEDARRTPWIGVPQAVYALAVLRMIALNVLAVLRKMTRRHWTSTLIPWREIAFAVRVTLTSVRSNQTENLAFS
jgi:predicted transposase YbfD/YdcC